MGFVKYQHIERLNTSATEGINIGTCYIFPKIDGTNGSIWMGKDGSIEYGSRNRRISINDDNHNFAKTISLNENIQKFLNQYPYLRLYGEWLVPHSLKTYRDDSWKTFYVFDVVKIVNEEEKEYLRYEEYAELLTAYNIDFIPCIKKITNPTNEDFTHCLSINTYLIKDGAGTGEGIVIKNYEYKNRYGRVI